MKYEVDKKRIIVLDEHLDGFDREEWKKIMTRVLGRHYDELKGYGAGWTFPSHALDSFLTMVEKKETKSLYKHDIDPSLYILRDRWMKDLNNE